MTEQKVKILEKKKHRFIRTDAHKKKRLGLKWRKPKGLQNKRRLRKRGYSLVVKKGFQSPKQTRGLNNLAMKQIIVNSLKQLDGLNKKSEGLIVSSTLGNKKRLLILKHANKQGISVLNIDVDKKIKQIESLFEKRQKKKSEKENKKQETKKQEKTLKESKSKSKEETKEEDTEKKEKEKKDFDKLLTKKK